VQGHIFSLGALDIGGVAFDSLLPSFPLFGAGEVGLVGNSQISKTSQLGWIWFQ
jgi:hypothetical protein